MKQNQIYLIVGIIILGILLINYSQKFAISSGSKIVYVDENICDSKLIGIDYSRMNLMDLYSSFCVVPDYWLGSNLTCYSDYNNFGDYRFWIHDTNNENIFSVIPRDLSRSCERDIDVLIWTDNSCGINGCLGNGVTWGSTSKINRIFQGGKIHSLNESSTTYNSGDNMICGSDVIIIINENYTEQFINRFTSCIEKGSQEYYYYNQTITQNNTNIIYINNQTNQSIQTIYMNQTIERNNTIYINQTATHTVQPTITDLFKQYQMYILIGGLGLVYYLTKKKK